SRRRLHGRAAGGGDVTLIESVRQDRRRGLTMFEERFVRTRGGRRVERVFSLPFRTMPMPPMLDRIKRAGFRVDAVHGDSRGGDPDMNPRLRTIIADAKAANMPAENIKRAIRRGTGEEEGVTYEEITYEAYGPGGVAIIIETLTDNKNRTVGEVRHTLTKYGGNLGEANSVRRMFEKKSVLTVDKAKTTEEALMSAVLEAGADDMKDD